MTTIPGPNSLLHGKYQTLSYFHNNSSKGIWTLQLDPFYIQIKPCCSEDQEDFGPKWPWSIEPIEDLCIFIQRSLNKERRSLIFLFMPICFQSVLLDNVSPFIRPLQVQCAYYITLLMAIFAGFVQKHGAHPERQDQPL